MLVAIQLTKPFLAQDDVDTVCICVLCCVM